MMKKAKDAHKIQLTNDSSIGSKKSAHVLGYFEDDLLNYRTCNKLKILKLFFRFVTLMIPFHNNVLYKFVERLAKKGTVKMKLYVS